ncbi:hypothetical protein [Cellulomonas biazotea]|uniref:Uncharacterized protein n=1 Tax=Cellulomonas biazotea TaxID=1709 RepID=A0A402DM34_9CELL|nr:hypothetical protein [Cellulomonas biazotea]GCE75199.1 hypothetical protein CBZ_02550 [Cellulomonas biazotea]
MPAWGPGPFDAHPALDFLERLTLRHADVDATLALVPGSVDVDGVVAHLRRELRAAADGQPYACYAFPQSTYATAGLVAAVLTGADRHPVAPTTPRAARDLLGLRSHAGHAALLTESHALALQQDAAAAARVLAQPSSWSDEPDATVHLLAAAKQLAAVLSRTFAAGAVPARPRPTTLWGRVPIRRL